MAIYLTEAGACTSPYNAFSRWKKGKIWTLLSPLEKAESLPEIGSPQSFNGLENILYWSISDCIDRSFLSP